MPDLDDRRNATSEMHQRETAPAQMDKPEDKPDYSRPDALAKESLPDRAQILAAERESENMKPRE